MAPSASSLVSCQWCDCRRCAPQAQQGGGGHAGIALHARRAALAGGGGGARRAHGVVRTRARGCCECRGSGSLAVPSSAFVVPKSSMARGSGPHAHRAALRQAEWCHRHGCTPRPTGRVACRITSHAHRVVLAGGGGGARRAHGVVRTRARGCCECRGSGSLAVPSSAFVVPKSSMARGSGPPAALGCGARFGRTLVLSGGRALPWGQARRGRSRALHRSSAC